MDQASTRRTVSQRLTAILMAEPPTLDEIMGSVCEQFHISPDDIERQVMAKRMFCFCAHQWTHASNRAIGIHVNLTADTVSAAVRLVREMTIIDPIRQYDLDMLSLRAVERVLIRLRGPA